MALPKAVKQNIAHTAAKFDKENGARHQKLQEMRDNGQMHRLMFERLYGAEARWLERNGISWSPEYRAWMTEGFVAEAEVEAKPARVTRKVEAPADKEIVLGKFLRMQFGARVAVDRKGEKLISMRGRVGKATVSNPDAILRKLSKQAGLIKATTKGCVFYFAGRGKKNAVVSLMQVGKVHVLTMKAM